MHVALRAFLLVRSHTRLRLRMGALQPVSKYERAFFPFSLQDVLRGFFIQRRCKQGLLLGKRGPHGEGVEPGHQVRSQPIVRTVEQLDPLVRRVEAEA